VGCLAAIFLATVLCLSCGQVYRPVVVPIGNNPPNPANFHAVFGITNNVAPNPGTAMQIDVSGDSNIGQASMGINPTHAATVPNNSRIFVTSAGSTVMGPNGQLAGFPDVITSFSPAADISTATGLGSPVVFTLPNTGPNQSAAITSIVEAPPPSQLVTVTLSTPLLQAAAGGQVIISGVVIPGATSPGGYNGNFLILSVSGNTITYDDPTTGLASASGGTASVPLPTFCSYQPDFVTTTQTNAVYVANYGVETPTMGSGQTPNCTLTSTDSVAALNVTNDTISQIAYLPAGSHPILMAETPNGENLYVVNQGDGVSVPASVMNLSTTDLSTTATVQLGVNVKPGWIAMRPDGQRVYVLTEGDGLLHTIGASSGPTSVGVGANYVLYDKILNRLYVTSAAASTSAPGLLYVFTANGDAPTPLVTPPGNPPGTVMIPPVPPCATAPSTCGPVIPASIAALPDGSRFYVASYQIQSPCSDPNAGTGSCIIPMVTVFDAASLTIRAASSSLFGAELSLLADLCPPGTASTPCLPPFASGQYAVPRTASCDPAPVFSPSSTRFRLFATASADSSHVYVSICDAGAIADISTTTNTISQGTNVIDRLVTNLMAPFSAGALGTNNQPPPQSPVFLLTGQ
jgi:hypothetical protein